MLATHLYFRELPSTAIGASLTSNGEYQQPFFTIIISKIDMYVRIASTSRLRKPLECTRRKPALFQSCLMLSLYSYIAIHITKYY